MNVTSLVAVTPVFTIVLVLQDIRKPVVSIFKGPMVQVRHNALQNITVCEQGSEICFCWDSDQKRQSEVRLDNIK